MLSPLMALPALGGGGLFLKEENCDFAFGADIDRRSPRQRLPPLPLPLPVRGSAGAARVARTPPPSTRSLSFNLVAGLCQG